MEKLILFGILSLPLLFISLRTLSSIRNHGFYRFFGWECILWLLVSNYQFWFVNPFSFLQIASWFLLFSAIYYVVAGVILLRRKGKPKRTIERETLFHFEKTTELVETGIYKYIRHPLYGSLILLTWGAFLKNITLPLFLVAILSTILLYITALLDEKECIEYFGDTYRQYMRRSRMFIPFLL